MKLNLRSGDRLRELTAGGRRLVEVARALYRNASLVVFDESRIQTRRLATLNALTTSIARAGEHGPMSPTALNKLQDLMEANAVWFRLADGTRLTIFQHVGLSPEFLRLRSSIPVGDPLEPIPQENRPLVVPISKLDPAAASVLKQQRFRQVVIAPVPGKKSLVGNLVLANRRSKSYAPDEFEFLMTCGQQLGPVVNAQATISPAEEPAAVRTAQQ